MSGALYRDLGWLPATPKNFTRLCDALLEREGDLGRRIATLAGFALDDNALARLAKVIEQARARGLALAPLQPLRLGLLSNATTALLVPALVATAARHGFALECIEAPFGQVLQSALDPDSAFNRARPDVVLLALDYRALPLLPTPGDAAQARATLEAALTELEAIRTAVRRNSGAFCLVQTLARPPEAPGGSLESSLPGSLDHLVREFNRELTLRLATSSDRLLDTAALAETVGLAEWHDPAFWQMAKLPFAAAYLPLYADHVMRRLAAARGKSRRALVLDLDNTLWGGVIGDDGLEGIHLGQGDARGEAHLEVQQTALELRGRGVVLAVSSKNSDTVARLPFREHPDMLLKEEHIAVFQANWEDKASNISAIAKALSLGLDALVFLDDNPVERALVRQLLPQVAVPELPENPALYRRTLLAAGYFEADTFSEEDRRRADYYQANAERVALQGQVDDLDAYLASLQMTLTVQPFDATARARITQLINKSNQFNLTTRRYTEEQVSALEQDPEVFTLQARLRDRFGDNGVIAVLICRRQGSAWAIDTWLMSCRVLGRGVEQALLGELLVQARAQGIDALHGCYRPTERNGIVAEHYAKLGFTPLDAGSDGASYWVLETHVESHQQPPIAIQRGGALADPPDYPHD